VGSLQGVKTEPIIRRDMSDLTLRPAVDADLRAINDIYNHYVLHSTATYQEEPETMQGREAWFTRHGLMHPVIVAEVDGLLVGWGSLSAFHSRSAYRRTVENSIYVHPAHHRRGIGRTLLVDLIRLARDAGHHTIIALIDGDQPASVGLHAAHGFREAGHLREVGFKFGRWLNVVQMQLML
jgi:phosphinothricin acetyltransferase